MKFLVIINFKTYKNAIGKKAVSLAKRLDITAGKFKNVDVVLAVSNVDLSNVSKVVKHCKIYSEHIDDVDYGAHTGAILIEDIKANGGKGALINHSEDRRTVDVIDGLVGRCKIGKIKSIVCVENLNEGKKIDKFKPDFVAIEPKELIGGKISVAEAKPELIKNFVKELKSYVLVGAGIHSGEDVKIAKKLGAKGILLASGITKAKLPGRVLKELIKNA